MNYNLLKIDNIKFNSNIKFTEVSYLNSKKENKELIIKTPFLNLPFGIEKEYGNYILKLQVKKDNTDFLNFIKNIEEFIEEKFCKPVISQIRYHDKFDPIIITKILNRKNYIITEVINESNECVNFFSLQKKMQISVDIIIDKLWIRENDIIYKLKIKKIITKSV